MTDLETALLDDVRELLARWQVELADEPDAERERLWLLALEREQVVAVAYREDFMAERLADLPDRWCDAPVRVAVRYGVAPAAAQTSFTRFWIL